ncbi:MULTISPECIES: hypothetical protein [Burkholderiaceae]|uniref:hypothetical protein n=1 Tax=Burkholderiaceae TaxID=119060 RepID=UPI000F52C2AA|nr:MULTISPECIES: hypothetical protein [Burkholderiaceae]VVE12136.1 hypothetical protein PSP20601_02694 [Pandoraea sputorum]
MTTATETKAEKSIGSRIEELMKKGFTKLSIQEKEELNNLLAQNLEDSKEESFNAVIEEIKALILKNELDISEVAKALLPPVIAQQEIIFFKVPYKDAKGNEKFYNWAEGKKAVGISSKYYQKLKDADEEQKRKWATAEGNAWLDSEAGKQWLKAN